MGKTQIQFRCTEQFREDVEQWAKEQGLTVSEYLRESARKQHERNLTQ